MTVPGGVLIIGAGGLGCPAAFALGAGGVTRIGIADDDRVEVTNLHRQILHGAADVGQLKAVSLARAMGRRFPAVAVEVHALRFDAGSAAALVGAYQVIIDGSDNFATKFVANDAAVLAGKALVHGAAVGTGGQLLTVPAGGGRPCYRCLFEEPPPAGVGPSCAEAGVLGPVPGVIGALQGAEAVRLMRGLAPAFAGRLLQYDSTGLVARAVRFNANPTCAVCGHAPRIRTLLAANYSSNSSNGCATDAGAATRS